MLVDLTCAMLPEVLALQIFLESDHVARREYIRRRNTARDPDQDFGFIMNVLAIEHEQMEGTAGRADLRRAVHDAGRPAITRAAAGAKD